MTGNATMDESRDPTSLAQSGLSEDFYALMGRVVVVHGWIERWVTLLYQRMTGASAYTYVSQDTRSLIDETQRAIKPALDGLKRLDTDAPQRKALTQAIDFIVRLSELLENRNSYVHSAWLSDDFHPGCFIGLRYPVKDPNKGKAPSETSLTLRQHPARTLDDLRSDLADIMEVEALGRAAVMAWDALEIRFVQEPQ